MTRSPKHGTRYQDPTQSAWYRSASVKPGTIVAIRVERDSAYTVPAIIVEDRRNSMVVRFAAGNLKVVPLDQLAPASMADIDEFEAGRLNWQSA